jgi:hypothetical protein
MLLIGQVGVGSATAEEAGPSTGSGQSAVDAVTWSRVRGLRERLRLTDATLAALGCDREAAETALKRALAWVEANEAQWAARRAAVAAARKALRQAVGKVHAGPRDEALLAKVPQLKAAVAAR